MPAAKAEERIWLNAQINGEPVRLIFDSGANRLILFPEAAKRLGLKVTEAPPGTMPEPGGVVGAATEDCTLSLNGTAVRVYFAVVKTPTYVRFEEDGVLGWGPVSSNIFLIDAVTRTVAPLAKVPAKVSSWTRLRLQTNPILALEIPHEGSATTAVLVDTGSPNGAALHPQKWRDWKAAHTNQAATLDAYFMPGAGLVVKEQRWANELALGPVVLTGVPVMEANSVETTLGLNQFEASLGFAALKRLELIVDGKARMAYVRPRPGPPLPFQHNRLGAVFVPRDSQSDDLVAHVLADSPGWEGGIRPGDTLLKIDDLDVTHWRSDPDILPLSRFWERPAGTKLELTVKRGEETLKRFVTLRQILSPEANPPANSSSHSVRD